MYTKTQLCERTGDNINVQHAVFDRKRRIGGREMLVDRLLLEGERERERGGGKEREIG